MKNIKSFEEFVNESVSESKSGKDIIKVMADYFEYKFMYGTYSQTTPRKELESFAEGLIVELKKKDIKKI